VTSPVPETTKEASVPAIPKHARVLFTNAYAPYELKWGQSPNDLFGARMARGHAMFERSAEFPTWSLYLLAENISNPTTVLEYPRWADFEAAIRDGYDVVAIECKTMHVPRVARMVRAIREIAPGTQVVLGGYGISTLQEGVPHDPENHREYLLRNVDHFCRAEGVHYLRELLGDLPVDRPIMQKTLPPVEVRPYAGRMDKTLEMPAMLVSLGCPSACDFCATSAFFHHKKISVFSPAEIYETMKHHQRRMKQDDITFLLFDEDLFLDAAFVRELGRLIRSERSTWGFRWFSFGSMRALSQFTPDELRECGLGVVWIGVESGLTHGKANRVDYLKRTADVSPPDLFRNLSEVGIGTMGSMILGFDFHTPDNIAQDIDYFVGLRPTFHQVGVIRPCPGTKLYKVMKEKRRFKDSYTWEDAHLWESDTHHFEHFTSEEIKHWFEVAHERLRTTNGSPLLQIFEQHLRAHLHFSGHDSEFLRHQADVDRCWVERLYPVIVGLVRIAPSEIVRARTIDLLARAREALPASAVTWAGRRALGEVIGLRLRWLEATHAAAPKDWAPPLRATSYPGRPAPGGCAVAAHACSCGHAEPAPLQPAMPAV
jgi:haloalkane dehalogenase